MKKVGRPAGSKYNIEDFKGKKINRWTVNSFSHLNKSKEAYWNVTCECGVTSKIRVYPLVKGLSKGCRYCRPQSTPSKPTEDWTVDMVFPFYYFRVIKYGAIARNLEFTLTPTDFNKKFLEQSGKCALSGIDLVFGKKYKDYTATASLDRIDSTKGYIQGNIQWVHKTINIMKQDYNQEEFITFCRLVANNCGS